MIVGAGMKTQLVAIVATLLLVGCGKTQQPSPPETPPSETVAVALTSPPPPPAEAAEPVSETPAQQASKLKSDEPATTTIRPVEWKKATGGNWDMATRGNTEQIKQLLAGGMDVDIPDKEGVTALYRAAHNDQKETVTLLLGKGVNVNDGSLGVALRRGKHGLDYKKWVLEWGYTPLDVTLNDDVVNLLRKHGGKTAEELKAEGK